MTDFDRAIDELKLGNYSDGMVILERLLKVEPDSVDILYNLGMCYSEMGLIKKSIEVLEKCVRIAPEFANVLVALGFSYYQEGSDEKSMSMLLKSLELKPENVYALKNIGALYNKLSEPDKALFYLQKANTLEPAVPEVMLGLAQAYELLEKYPEAAQYFIKVKSSYASDMIIEKAIEGLNRVAVSELKRDGHAQRTDIIMHCLSAIEMFAKMSSDSVKEITFEIAMLGNSGLSINEPEKKYTLESKDGKYSGMQLLCYMFVGFKIIDENLPPVADLESEYKQALKIYRSRLNEH